ncbi:MAG: hypothetical protein ACW97P_06325 [Candidatus Hodarchaeales archaeon]|jgi:hypothetical protein
MTQVTNLIIENPFHSFTARADIPEMFNLSRPNKNALKRIVHALEVIKKKKRESMIVPVIAEAGYGKTHFYWVVREQISDAYCIYVPVPTNTSRIFSHFYFETIKAGGAALLEYVADYLTQKYKKAERAAFDFPGLGNIVIDGFFALKDPKQSKLALKWFTGFDLDNDTKSFSRTILDDEELSFVALQIILKSIDKPIIFFVDELESLFISLGPEAELQLLESLKKMHNEASNFLICLACLATLWDKILDLSSTAVQSRIEPPILLKRFTKKDIREYCIYMLKDFHVKFDLLFTDEENLIWPLGKADIESSYAYSHGNPREAIKWLAGVIEEKKAPILKELGKNQKILGQISKKVKKQLESIDGYSVGILHKNNGLLVSLFGKKRKLLLVPPQESLNPVFHSSFVNNLKQELEKEEYSEVILFGDTAEFDKLDMDVKVIPSENYAELVTYISEEE